MNVVVLVANGDALSNQDVVANVYAINGRDFAIRTYKYTTPGAN